MVIVTMPFVIATVACVLVLLVVTDLTFRLGRALRSRSHEEHWLSQIATVQGATLGLLALMLGFTMSMAESRFSARRQINVAEAAATSTTYLRASLLPEPERSETRALLRRYVALRRAYYGGGGDRAQIFAQTASLQDEIWRRAMSAANAHPTSYLLGTYIESTNQMFDMEAARTLAVAARLPMEIHFVVLLVAIVTVGITGFVTGASAGRNVIAMYIVPALVAITYSVIIDLDRSWFGFISTSDRPMEQVERMIDAETSSASR